MTKHFGDLRNLSDFQALLRRRLEEGWTYKKIEPMSTNEIFDKLNRLGISVTAADYQEAAQQHESAERLADEWHVQYPLRPEGRYDDDFVWMSSIVLWKRLIPDRICFEQINERMQEGYDLLEKQRTAEACDAWWQVWEWIKEKVTTERNTVVTLDEAFRGTQSIYNWCGHFDMELHNAGLDDPEYCRLRIRYCREFLETFDVECLMRDHFLRAEAESYWHLGDIETAETRFKALIEENPDWAWGYINWSDLYWISRNSPKDYVRGEALLKRALARRNLEDREDVLDRLDRLRAERAHARVGTREKKRKRRTGKRSPKRRKK